jgi:hypothetical protein
MLFSILLFITVFSKAGNIVQWYVDVLQRCHVQNVDESLQRPDFLISQVSLFLSHSKFLLQYDLSVSMVCVIRVVFFY